MKCFRRNPCKGKPTIFIRKGSVPIKVYTFFLAALFFSMATVVITQAQAVPQSPATSMEEDRILNSYYAFRGSDPNWFKELEHYMMDGCKIALAGDWRWDIWGDIITITYNEKYKVFLGNVTRPVKMDVKKGHLLFKAYFSHEWLQGIQISEHMDIHWLRQQKECKGWGFIGTEFSFDQRTKMKTEMKLVLILNADQLQYKLEKKAWNLTRLR